MNETFKPNKFSDIYEDTCIFLNALLVAGGILFYSWKFVSGYNNYCSFIDSKLNEKALGSSAAVSSCRTGTQSILELISKDSTIYTIYAHDSGHYHKNQIYRVIIEDTKANSDFKRVVLDGKSLLLLSEDIRDNINMRLKKEFQEPMKEEK